MLPSALDGIWVRPIMDECELGRIPARAIFRGWGSSRGDAAWCDMTWVELWHGARGTQEKRQLAQMVNEIDGLVIDSAVCQMAQRLALRCREAGVTVPSTDIVIAACASRYQIELEHCDSHFDRIMPIATRL